MIDFSYLVIQSTINGVFCTLGFISALLVKTLYKELLIQWRWYNIHCCRSYTMFDWNWFEQSKNKHRGGRKKDQILSCWLLCGTWLISHKKPVLMSTNLSLFQIQYRQNSFNLPSGLWTKGKLITIAIAGKCKRAFKGEESYQNIFLLCWILFSE